MTEPNSEAPAVTAPPEFTGEAKRQMTPDPIRPEEILNNLVSLISNPAHREAFKKAIQTADGDYFGRNIDKPYYKKKYALGVKEVLDWMMEHKKPRKWVYADFPSTNKASLYQKIMQGKEFLLDNMDPDGRYKKFDLCVKVDRKQKDALYFHIQYHMLNMANSEDIEDLSKAGFVKSEELSWRDRLENFLENGKPGESFKKEGLALDESEITELETTLCTLTTIVYNITEKSVVVRKTKSDVTGI